MSDIGTLTDERHWISYDDYHSFGFVHSDTPKKVKKTAVEDLLDVLSNSLVLHGWTNAAEASNLMVNLANKTLDFARQSDFSNIDLPWDHINQMDTPVRATALAALYLRLLLDVEMIIVGKKTMEMVDNSPK